MLALGFSSGLPAVLVFGTLSIWLRARSVSLETIAFFSLVSLVYSVKFIWAPVVDRVGLPLITARLGLRRSWMLVSQLLVALISLFSALPAGSYAMVAMPSALGAGYAMFFVYSAALGLPTILLALKARR